MLIDCLESAIPLLAEKDARFASSLVEQHRQGRTLSEKQMFWVHVMLKRAGLNPSALVVRCGV